MRLTVLCVAKYLFNTFLTDILGRLLTNMSLLLPLFPSIKNNIWWSCRNGMQRSQERNLSWGGQQQRFPCRNRLKMFTRKQPFILEKTTVVFKKTLDVFKKTLDVFGKTLDVFFKTTVCFWRVFWMGESMKKRFDTHKT